VSECSSENWDGCDALPISVGASKNTEQFINVIPAGLPLPECAPENDGAISLDWTLSRYRRFSVSLDDSDRLAYAWMDGEGNTGSAVEKFDGTKIPVKMYSILIDIIVNENTAVRAA